METREQKSEEERLEELRDMVRAFQSRVVDTEQFELLTDLMNFANQLKADDPEADLYLAYHALSGSTIEPDIPVKGFDFPDHRIERFIREKLDKALKA